MHGILQPPTSRPLCTYRNQWKSRPFSSRIRKAMDHPLYEFSLHRPRLPAPHRLSPHSLLNGNGATPPGLDFVTFTFIVDDIVLPTGQTKMKCLGGGGAQTLWGYSLAAGAAHVRIGLSAGVGDDIQSAYGECLRYLQAMGTDTSALIPVPGHKTPHAWQLFEECGLRTQVWRVPVTPTLWSMLRPDIDAMPAHFKAARAFHLGVDPSNVASFVDMMGKLKALADANYGLFSVEPYTHSNRALTNDELDALCSAAHVFSPNELEAMEMIGRPKDARPTTAPEMSEAMFYIDRLHDHGAPVVALRRGAQGVVISTRNTGALRVPACSETRVVDVTGCGNSFIGGMMRILQERSAARMQASGLSDPTALTALKCTFSADDLLEAALCGSAAASLMAESLGMPQLPPVAYVREAERRVASLRRRAAPVLVQ